VREPDGEEQVTTGVLRPPLPSSQPAESSTSRAPNTPVEEGATEEVEEEEVDDILWEVPEAETSWLPPGASEKPLAGGGHSTLAKSQWLDGPAEVALAVPPGAYEADTDWEAAPEAPTDNFPGAAAPAAQVFGPGRIADQHIDGPIEPDSSDTIRLEPSPIPVTDSQAAPQNTQSPRHEEPAQRALQGGEQDLNKTIRLPSRSREPAGVIHLGTEPNAALSPDEAPAITHSLVDAHPQASSVTLFGTAAPDCAIEISDWTVPVGNTRVGPDGLWTQTLLAVAEGTHTYKATATDIEGKTLGSSAPYPVTIDAAAAPETVANPQRRGRHRIRPALLALAGGLAALIAVAALAFLTLTHGSSGVTVSMTPGMATPAAAARNLPPYAVPAAGSRPTIAPSTAAPAKPRARPHSSPRPARVWTFAALRPTTDQVILTLSNGNKTSVDVDIRARSRVQQIRIPQASGVEMQLSPQVAAEPLTVTASAPILPVRLVIHNHSVQVTEGTAGADQSH